MKALTKMVFTVFTVGVASFPAYADTVTKTTTTVTTMRTGAPIYVGPVQQVELQELTLKDFEYLTGSKPIAAWKRYNEYKNELSQPRPNSNLVPYKMRITDRNLTLADFQGVHVPAELAQARHQEYLRINPITTEGRNARFVYVYHTPITRTV